MSNEIMSGDPKTPPTCDMVEDCREPITHIDIKGYVYCTTHGLERQGYQRCRKLREGELKKILRGEALERY